MNRFDTSALLFYDALSGEFYPATDPEHRAHTLARLCVASFQKGERTPAAPDVYRYTPSWAAGTVAVAHAAQNGRPDNLRLETDDERVWANFELLTPQQKPNGPHVRITDSTGYEVVQRLELGPDLSEFKVIAAEAAQEFYK